MRLLLLRPWRSHSSVHHTQLCLFTSPFPSCAQPDSDNSSFSATPTCLFRPQWPSILPSVDYVSLLFPLPLPCRSSIWISCRQMEIDRSATTTTLSSLSSTLIRSLKTSALPSGVKPILESSSVSNSNVHSTMRIY